jgi:bromodomain-containing factor 1
LCCKDYPETFTTQRKLSLANKTIEMKFCFNVLKEFKKNKYRHQMYAFLQPVDPISLNIPDYFQIIQHPMDLSTIENKLLNDEYKSPLQFKDDVLLMFNNCYTYNPPSLPIYSMAKQMEKVFQDMWATRPTETNTSNAATSKKSKSPPPKKARKSIDNNNMNDDKIAELERTIHNIRQQVESMKKTAKKPPVKRKRTPVKRVVHHSSDEEEEEEEEDKSPPQQQEIIYTYKQKMALSERINRLNIDELNGVVEIIQNSMPNLKGNGDNEIELDMDKLDTNTLCQLHNFIFPNQPIGLSNTNKKQKRQHYTENATNRKIRQLENTLKKFESQKKKRNDGK